MNRTPVSSSHLVSVGYDEQFQTLEIEFKDGSVYQYFDVPDNVYEDLMQAPSQGKFLHAHIMNFYRDTRL